MMRGTSTGGGKGLFSFPWFSGEKRQDPRLRRAMDNALEPLEQRVLMAVDTPLQPNQFTAIKNGLAGLSNWADTLDNFGDFAKQLPVVGRSIGQSLDLGDTLRTSLLNPINGLAGPSPAQIASSIQGAFPGTTVTPVVDDPAHPNEIRFDVTFNRTRSENRSLDFGTNAETINADASFTAALNTKLTGNLSFGFDLTAGLSDSEAFFVRLAANNGLVANASVGLNPANFGISLGSMGADASGANGARVVNGNLALSGGVSAALVDQDANGKITLDELDSTTLGSIVSVTRVHNGNDLSATLPVEAKLGSFTGSGTVTVTDADLFDATAPTVALTNTNMGDFKNLTPAGLVSLVRNVGTSLQTAAQGLNPDGGIPFVGDALSQAVNFGDLLDELTRPLFDVKLAGASSYTSQNEALDATKDAAHFTLSVTVGTNTFSKDVTTGTGGLQIVVDSINSQISGSPVNGLVSASVDGKRVKIAAVDPDNTVTVQFHADDKGMEQLGFEDSLSNATFRFTSIQSVVPLLAQKMGVTPAALNVDYDVTGKALLFNVKFQDVFNRTVELNFTDSIPLGVAGQLGVTGGMEGSVEATANADIRLGINIGNLADFVPGDTDPLSQAGGNDFFVESGGKVSATAKFKGTGDLTAALGLLELGVHNAVADFNVAASMTLGQPSPGDTHIEPKEFILPSVVTSPALNAGGSVNLPLTLEGAENVGVTLPSDAAVKLNFSGPPVKFTADVTGVQSLVDQFGNFSTDSVLAILKQAVGLIQNSDLPLFNEPLPLVGKSVKELLAFGQELVDGLDAATKNIQELRKVLLGDGTTGAAGGLFGMIKEVIATSPLFTTLNGLGEQGEHAAHDVLESIEALEDASRELPEVVDDAASFRMPAGLVSAINGVKHALEHASDFAKTLPDGQEPRTTIEAGIAEIESKLGPITKAVPTIQRLAAYLFEALNLQNLVDLDALQNTVKSELQQTLDKLDDNTTNAAARAAIQEVIGLIDEALGLSGGSSFAPLAPSSLDPAKLLDALSGLDKLIKDFGSGTNPLADDPSKDDEPGDFARKALADLARSIPGKPEVSLDGDDLNIGFKFDLEKSTSQKLDFDITKGPQVFPLEIKTGGEIDLGIGANLQLDFGVDLGGITDDVLQALYFRDSTKLSLSGLIDSTDFTAGVSIGGIDVVTLGPDGHRGTITLKNDANDGPAEFGLRMKNTADHKVPLSTFGLSAFELFEDGALNVSIPIQVDDKLVTVDGTDAGAVDPLKLTVTDLKKFSDLDFNIPDKLGDTLKNELLSLDFLFKGIKAFIDKLRDGVLKGIIAKFPFIGDGLDLLTSGLGLLLAPSSSDAPAGASKLVGPFVPAKFGPTSAIAPGEGFLDKLQTRLEDIKNNAGAKLEQALEDALKQAFFDLLGPGGINILKLDPNYVDSDPGDGKPDTVADFHDVQIDVQGDLDEISNTKVIAHLPIGMEDDSIHSDFDLGFNGLGLVGFQTTGAVEIGLNWSVDLAFELSKASGFVILLNDNPLDPTDTKEVELEANAHLAAGTKLNANLFFLALEAEDHNGQTSLGAKAFLDLEKAGDRLPVNDFSGLQFKPGLSANMHVDLGLRTGISTGKITPNANFPSLTANLLVDWDFLSADGSGVSANSPKAVELDDISLDLGEFIGKALAPIVDTIDDFLAPIKPILDFLNTEIPVISQVAQLVGMDPVRFIDAIAALGSGADSVKQLVDILSAVTTIVGQAKTIAGQGSLVIPFGDLKFTGADKLDTQVAKNFDDNVLKNKFTNKFTDAFDQLNGDAKDFIDGLTGKNKSASLVANQNTAAFGTFNTDLGTFSIPLFENPLKIVNLLMGQDVDLVTWDIPRMEAKFEFSQLFGPIIPPFPVFAKIGGGFGIFCDLYLGMDTRGIRTGDFFKGIYFGDTLNAEPGGKEVPELGVNMEFKAGAELSIPFAKAGVEGGIQAEITADWNDPDKDGRVHLDELVANFEHGLQCVFDLAGKLDAFIGAYLNIEIPLGFTSITIVDVSFDIFRATIFDFSVTCPPLPPPVPATNDGGILRLNIGDRAAQRQQGATDGDETITVYGEMDRDGDGIITKTEDVNGDGKITEDELGDDIDGDGVIEDGVLAVAGFGVFQIVNGPITKIVGNAGEGKDQVVIDKSVRVGAEITGGAGDDNLQGGSGNDTLSGGDGADEITGGWGNDLVTGGEGNDKLAGNAGADTVKGEGGDDQLFGGSNDGNEGTKTADLKDDDLGDTVEGGAGNDQVYGHLGNDNVSGGDGADTVSGGAGDDTVGGGADNDLLFGDGGNDTVTGGAGDDQMKGGDGDDTMTGEAGKDYVEGGKDNDNLDGGTGDDILIGGSSDEAAGDVDGNDTITGGSGNDIVVGDNGRVGDGITLTGGNGNDVVNAGAGNDTVFGQGGDDNIHGDGDNDTITAGEGNDTAHGDAGNDTVLGNGGADHLFGDAGDDTIEAGAGNDTAFGGTGADLVKGQEGDDYLEGNADSDVILGGVGNDSIIGGSSSAGDLAAGLDAGDSIVGAAGDDIILGDNGTIVGLVAHTIETGGAGSDTVYGSAGSDTIFGGGLGDLLVGDSAIDSGNDLVVGDEGDRDASQIVSRHSNTGGNDSIFGSAGIDTLLGGDGADQISGDAGDDIALGDNGRVLVSGTTNLRVETTDPTIGGNDTMVGGFGSDIMLGGAGSDTITGDVTANDDIPVGTTADDILLGDNGFIQLVAQLGKPRIITTSDPTAGSSDFIVAGDGNDVVMGGTDAENISAGEGRDLVFGDHGMLLPDGAPNDNFFSIDTGAAQGGAGDTITGEAGDDSVVGGQGADNITGGDQDDDLIGGHNVAGGADAGDVIDGGNGNDLIAGDNAHVIRRTDSASPLVRALAGPTMYKLGADGFFTATYEPNITGVSQKNPSGAVGRDVFLFDHAFDTTAEKYGADNLAGGAGNDSVFGQLGDDTLQGDASVAPLVNGQSVDNPATDGDDYVEGGGGADLIYGNQGQDDLIGGSSKLFGLDSAGKRPDGADVIFGGSGNRTARNDAGDTDAASGHANDADVIIGDNGTIYRLVVVGQNNATSFVTFNYDNYGGKRLVPRAVELLDYTADDNAANDIGGADVIHGEAGDDSIHGMGFDDILYGDGQDDDVFGESGNDWMSGGTGVDGMLGDDGKIMTSRNGLAEPLYNVVATVQQVVATPGNIHVATLNATGQLNKGADLDPFDIANFTFGRDTMYGGMGDDRMHGGMNNDAMSGAEALDVFYNNPKGTPVLQFNNATGKFNVAGDPFALVDSPSMATLKKINGHLLNFSEAEIDGNDAIFGDNGNDWIVGGRGSDHLYGGRGNDVLNADDNLNTNGGLNDVPDTGAFAEADSVFGGGGRDTLLANCGDDRLIDWTGEFNTYVVPFAPFGDRTVTRQIVPGIVDFLLKMSKSDGADQTRVGTGANLGAADRNGEPFGELGMVLQKDSDWQAQTGGPVDDQAGNKPGGKK